MCFSGGCLGAGKFLPDQELVLGHLEFPAKKCEGIRTLKNATTLWANSSPKANNIYDVTEKMWRGISFRDQKCPMSQSRFGHEITLWWYSAQLCGGCGLGTKKLDFTGLFTYFYVIAQTHVTLLTSMNWMFIKQLRIFSAYLTQWQSKQQEKIWIMFGGFLVKHSVRQMGNSWFFRAGKTS